jgi:hypothetical protein
LRVLIPSRTVGELSVPERNLASAGFFASPATNVCLSYISVTAGTILIRNPHRREDELAIDLPGELSGAWSPTRPDVGAPTTAAALSCTA